MADYFIDRDVEFPGRMSITPVGGTIATAEMSGDDLIIGSGGGLTADIERAEGTITEAGTPLNAQNLNAGIKSMMGDLVRTYVISATAGVQVPIQEGAEYIVIWTGAGATGSRGMDYIWIANGAIVSRSQYLTGTQLILYSLLGDHFVMENSASATTVHATVIGNTVST